ncbi:PAS domain S-box protein, partial [Rhodoferax sp.]|uniref:PAS domain S-box protein n=1 Tax=Rhodoferax sp. TaxID=50421 RepID=UPI00262ABDD8
MDQTKATYLPISGLTLFTGVGLLGVILLVVFGLINEYRNSIHYAHTEVKTLTRLLEGHASATVDKVDLLLREVQKSVHPEDMRLPPGAIPSRRKEWHQLLKSLLEHVPEAEVIHISNVTGDHIYSSIDPLPSINIIDRYHFTRQRDDPLAGLVMSPALRSRTTGKWTLVLTRRLNFEDGRFAGIINVVLKPEYFQQFYQTLDLNSHGLVALYDESWHLLARYPAGGKDLGKKIDLDAGTPVEKEASQSSFIARSPLDGVKRIYSYRKVGQLPLYVLSAIAEDDYLAEWQRHVWQYSLGTLIFCVVVISFSWRQRRANKALRHSEENLRIIADHTYDWEYWEGAEHDIRYMSPACQRVTGYAPQEFINNPALIHQIVHPDDRHVLEAHSHVSPSDLAEISFRIIRRDGGIRWITHGCQAVYGKSGQYLGRRVCNRDETERKKLELMTKEFEAIVQSSNDAVIGKSLDGIITSWNHGAEALFGYSAEEMIGSHMNRLFPVDRIDEENFILKHIAAGKTVQHLETVRVHKSGKLIDISVTFSPIHDNNGKVIGISKVARDITDHKKAESALRRASLYARSLIEASLDPLVTISTEGKITDVNRATEAVTGHLREELIGSDFSSYFTDPSEASRGYQKVFSEGSVKDYPLAIRHVSGTITEVLYNASLYRNEA